jgi:hypothetical protein
MSRRPLHFRWPTGLVLALFVAVAFHGGLLLAGSYRGTFDAFVHMFFADHYRRSWFSSFESRWYTGFSVFSYPPGSHQALALVSKVIGLELAFCVIALFSVVSIVVGTFRFAQLWTTKEAAGYAALLMALSSSLAESLHVFGQLPTLFALGFLLNGLPFVYRWIRFGGTGNFMLAMSACAATTAVHHVTTIFGSVFFVGPVIVRALLDTREASTLKGGSPNEVVVGGAVLRTAVYGLSLILAVAVVVLPYWLWSAADPISQVPIPHASRDNFISNRNAGLIFFLIPWGALCLIVVQSVTKAMRTKSWPLAASVLLAALLGTGGTTPIPRLLLGASFDVLTLDRFTLWATFLVLPLAATRIESLVSFVRRPKISVNTSASRAQVALQARLQTTLLAFFVGATVLLAVFTANLSRFRPSQPRSIDTAPIVRFMGKEEHDRWRYLTLGFGDQMASLSAQMTAQSVDGNYHSARRLPELTTTPVERLEAAKYKGVAGLGSLQQVIGYPDKYHLKFVFSNDHYYDPLLDASGWQRIEPLDNGIAVWVREDITPIPTLGPSREAPIWQRLIWGVLPISAIVSALTLLFSYSIGLRGFHRLARLLFNRRPSWMTWVTIGDVPQRIVGRLVLGALTRCESVSQQGQLIFVSAFSRLKRRKAHGLIPAIRRSVLPILVGCLLVAGGVKTVTSFRKSPGAAETMYAYYVALDGRQTDAAFELLDPLARPSHEQFVRERTLANGLVASYAELSGITRLQTVVDSNDRSRAKVSAQLNYVTAFSKFTVSVQHHLRRSGGRWLMDPPEVDLSTPPDQLVVRPGVAYYDQGRREVLALTTPDVDLLDRPDIYVVSAHLVRVDGQFSIVGEAINVDVLPARLTVNATLLGSDGKVLARTANSMTSMHSAMPGELVPFRVDFVGVSGQTTSRSTGASNASTTAEFVERIGELRVRPVVPSDIASVEVSVSSVAAHSDVDRSLMIDSARLGPSGQLVVTYRNDGLEEVTVPHAFLTLRRADGSVGWVQSEFLSSAIRPQRHATDEPIVMPSKSVQDIPVKLEIFTNNQTVPTAKPSPPMLGPIAGWSGVDLNIVGFTRNP